MRYLNHIQQSAVLLILLLAGWVSHPVSAQTTVEVVPDPLSDLIGTDTSETAIQPLESWQIPEYGITIKFAKGTSNNNPAYYYNGNNIRLYSGNTFTIESSSTYEVESILFNTGGYKTTAPSLSAQSGTVVYDSNSLNYSWNNTEQKSSVTFDIKKYQFRMTRITLTLRSKGATVQPPQAPLFSQSSCQFSDAFELVIADPNDPPTTIKYTLDGTDPSADNGLTYTAPIVIPQGNTVTVKSVCINENGVSAVTSATYTYLAKYLLRIEIPNKSGISRVTYSNYGYYARAMVADANDSTYVTAGDRIALYFQLNTGYKLNSVRLNGEALSVSNNQVEFTMPSSDAKLIVDVLFDPASPSDPKIVTPVQKYALSLVCNPSGSAVPGGAGMYAEGESVYVSASTKSGYVFNGWSKDGEIIGKNQSFTFTMPASDVVLTANYVFNPANPTDPQKPILKHPLTVIASPSGGGSFGISGTEFTEGQEYTVRAYPNTGYIFKGWIVNGVAQTETSTSYTGIMTEAGAQVVALFKYSPSSPDEPNLNYYDKITGRMIVDHFTEGSLQSAIQKLVTSSNYSNVTSLIVKGKTNSTDISFLRNLSTLQSLDLSRTASSGTLQNYAFQNMVLTSLILPSDIESLGGSVFKGCSNLLFLSLHSLVPPTVAAATFSGFSPENCTLRVPEESISLYKADKNWNQFANIVPLGDAIHVLEVQIPTAYRDGKLKNNRIEVVNMATGHRQRYVITDRNIYTFNGAQKDDQYLVLLTSETGLVRSRIENIIMPDADHSVAFSNIKAMVPVRSTVTTPDGNDCTNACTVEWYERSIEGKEIYLSSGATLGNVPEGEVIIAKVTLPRDLAIKYISPKPAEITVTAEMDAANIALEPLKAIVLSGRVLNDEGATAKNATVKIYQKIAKKYDKSSVVKVDADGRWSSPAVNSDQIVLTYSASECLNRIDTITPDLSQSVIDCGDVTMASSVGARIHVTLSYTDANFNDNESSTLKNYTDIENVSFSVYNRTKGRNHIISVQYPSILILEQDLDANDELVIKAIAANGEFHNTEVVVPVGADARPNAQFLLIGKGGIRVEYGQTDNPQTVAILFNSKGKAIKLTEFQNKTATFAGLDAGKYSVVGMTRSSVLNAVASLSALNELGLEANKDYVLNEIDVTDGKASAINFKEVPSVDESLFTYTGNNTSITPNKNSVTTGQYVTIRSLIDFKPIYRNRVSNVRIEYALPEGCSFIDGSVMKGSKKFGYDRNGNNVIVDFGSDYSDQLRFCLVPTHSGQLSVVARVIFQLDGNTVIQPIGNANLNIKDLDFELPSRTCYKEIIATGAAPAYSNVRILQDGTVVGESTASPNGAWTVECTLIDTYNQKDCQMQAVVTTPEKLELVSSVRTVVYDEAAIMIDRVTMLTGSEEVIFDFNHKNNTKNYTWVDGKLFTFIVKLTDNAPENLSGVRLFVKTLDGGERAFDCYYSESRNAWLCVGNFTSETAPINVSVSLFTANGLVFDRDHLNAFITNEEKMKAEAQETKKTIESLRQSKIDIEAQTQTETKALDAFLQNYDSFSDEERLKAVNDMLVKAGSDPIKTDYSEDLLGDKAEIAKIFETSQALLLPLEDYDSSEMDSLLSRFKEFQSDCGLNDDVELIANSSVVAGEYKGQEYTYCSVTADQIDLSLYDESQIRILNTDDGSQIKIITTGTEVIVIDDSQNRAWIVLYNTAKQSRLRKANSDIDWQEFSALAQQIKEFVEFLKSNIDAVCAKAEHMIELAERDIEIAEKQISKWTSRMCECRLQIIDIESEAYKIQQQLNSNKYISIEERQRLKDLYWIYKDREKAISQELKIATDNLGKAKTTKAILEAKGLAFKGVVDKATAVLDVVWRLGKAWYWWQEARTVHEQWLNFIDTILPCEADNENAMRLSGDAAMADIEVAQGYLGALRCAVGSGITGIISTGVGNLSSFVGNPIAGIAIKGLSIIGDIVSGMIFDKAKSIYEDTRSKSQSYFAQFVKQRNQLKCKKKKEDDPFDDPNYSIPKDIDNNKIPAGNDATKRVAIDPAGYVYEGVHSNRIEGVKATAYYREKVEDMFGDISLKVNKWNAEEFAQKNPLFTDVNGMYAWDVPAGEWQVKFEKDGYNTSYSEWLPVPPPQLEVNVEITQNVQPEIIDVHAYAEGVDISFDKFMDIASLNTSTIYVTSNGTKLSGSIVTLNQENSTNKPGGKPLASKVRFVPEQPLSVNTGVVRLTVSRNVFSYAGIPMAETYSQELDIEKEILEITADVSLLKVLYGDKKTATISVIPPEAGSGRTLKIANTSPLVLSTDVDEIVLDSNGQGKIVLNGNMPGSSNLIFSVNGSDKTGSVGVDVLTEIITAEAPKASRASGTAVYRGTKVELTSESKNATIYFTTDGSCPCDENGTRRKYTVPIVINDDTKILAMTSVGKGDDDVSEIIEFNYTLKRSDMDFQLPEGWTWLSHNFESGITPADLAADKGISRILSQTQEVIRDPQLGLVGSLSKLSAAESYKVETTAATERQRLSNFAWNPATPIKLNSGWNWLGYPVSQTMSVNEAFATTNAETLDVVVGQNGFAQFDGEKWVGTLETLSPGMGYMYQSQSAKDVVYNTSIVSTASAKYAPGISDNSPLVVDIHKYRTIMPVIASLVNYDGMTLDNKEYQVAAFCGSECRGIGRVVDGLVMMNVYGNVNDPITFHVTDSDGKNGFSNKASLKFTEAVIGDLCNPYAISINSQSGISDVTYNGNIQIFVEGDMLCIKGIPADEIRLVEVYNTNGLKLIHKNHVSESGIKISNLATGVYVIIINSNGEYTYHKIEIR